MESTPLPLNESREEPLQPSATPRFRELLLNLAILVLRRRYLVLLTTSLTLLLGILLAFVLPPNYTATCTFLPPQQSASSASSMMAQLGGLGALAGLSSGGISLKNPSDLYIGLLQTETVEEGMIKRFDLMTRYRAKRMSQARKMLEQHTVVDGKQKDGMVRISVIDHSPQRASELANGYLEELQKLSGNLAISEAAQRRRFLEQQMEESREKLIASEDALKRTEEKTGVIHVEAQTRALIESATELRAQIAAKEIQVQAMRTYAGTGNVDLIEAEQQLAGMHAQLKKLSSPTIDRSSDLAPQKDQLAQGGLEYLRNAREVKYQEALFEILARQLEAAKLDEAREGVMIQLVDSARPPDYRSGPKRAYLIAGFFLFGLTASIGYIVLINFLRGMATSKEYEAQITLLNTLRKRHR